MMFSVVGKVVTEGPEAYSLDQPYSKRSFSWRTDGLISLIGESLPFGNDRQEIIPGGADGSVLYYSLGCGRRAICSVDLPFERD